MSQRDYTADGLTVHWDSSVCSHAAECVKAAPAVFDPERRPWIDTSAGSGDEIAAAIDRCPSGALSYTRDEPDEDSAPATTISVRPDGPLMVTGAVQVVDDDGNVVKQAERLALCRCGDSANKPYCDGAHKAAGFRAPGISPTSADE